MLVRSLAQLSLSVQYMVGDEQPSEVYIGPLTDRLATAPDLEFILRLLLCGLAVLICAVVIVGLVLL